MDLALVPVLLDAAEGPMKSMKELAGGTRLACWL